MRWMKLACVALITAVVGLASVGLTPGALAQSRNETLLVVTESGPNSLDIHGVGANRPAYGVSWNVYDRLITYGKKTLPDGTAMLRLQRAEARAGRELGGGAGRHVA